MLLHIKQTHNNTEDAQFLQSDKVTYFASVSMQTVGRSLLLDDKVAARFATEVINPEA
jgi:hypothetical protein